MKIHIETDAQYEKRKMNLLELEEQIKEHKVIQKFKDGVADALLHGNRDESKLFSAYYKQGYDFGLTMWNEQQGEIADELA